MKLECDTDKLILLLGCQNDSGIWLFYRGDGILPGLESERGSLGSIRDQLEKLAKTIVPQAARVVISHRIDRLVEGPDGEKRTLFLGSADQGLDGGKWHDLPSLIRDMEVGKNRIAYIHAMQIMAGGLQNEQSVSSNLAGPGD